MERVDLDVSLLRNVMDPAPEETLTTRGVPEEALRRSGMNVSRTMRGPIALVTKQADICSARVPVEEAMPALLTSASSLRSVSVMRSSVEGFFLRDGPAEFDLDGLGCCADGVLACDVDCEKFYVAGKVAGLEVFDCGLAFLC